MGRDTGGKKKKEKEKDDEPTEETGIPKSIQNFVSVMFYYSIKLASRRNGDNNQGSARRTLSELPFPFIL